jgi:hypothetical protein
VKSKKKKRLSNKAKIKKNKIKNKKKKNPTICLFNTNKNESFNPTLKKFLNFL